MKNCNFCNNSNDINCECVMLKTIKDKKKKSFILYK